MPYYRWKGVDLNASTCKGVYFARSPEELDTLLLEKEVALLSYNPLKIRYKRPITYAHRMHFFEKLASLLNAGVSLPNALKLIAQRTDQKYFGLVLQEISENVSHGISFCQALSAFPTIFDNVITSVAAAGLETGNITNAMDLIAEYQSTKNTIQKKLKSALIMPIITLLFFVSIAAILIIMVVPRFAHLLQSMNQQLPPLTKKLIFISSFLNSMNGLLSLLALFIGSLVVYRFLSFKKCKIFLDSFLIGIPVVKNLIIKANIGAYFQSLGMLLSGGMHIVSALNLAMQACNNHRIAQNFEAIAPDVACGYTLSQALSAHLQKYIHPQTISMIAIAEETGSVGSILSKIGKDYFEEFYGMLNLMTTLIQPILMIFLGLLITLFIMAIYTPIFNLSYIC